jgi:hypothetical protein
LHTARIEQTLRAARAARIEYFERTKHIYRSRRSGRK